MKDRYFTSFPFIVSYIFGLSVVVCPSEGEGSPDFGGYGFAGPNV